jgi:hypothetical protein
MQGGTATKLKIGINEGTALPLGVAVTLGFKGGDRLTGIGGTNAPDLTVFPIGKVVSRWVLGE